jgi:tetratricopeptide (TPR) repeat protein
MPEDHPDPQTLESFMRDETTRDENRAVVRHLLVGCGECLQVTRRLWRLGETRLEAVPSAAGAELPARSYGDVFSQLAERGPRRAAFALHALALQLAGAGRGEEALQAVRRARPIYEQYVDRPNLLRLRRLEGQIEEAHGSLQEAERAFLEARRGFLLARLGAEAAAVLLDLALLYQREGRTREVHRLAGELLPILRAGGLRQGAAVALLFFRDLVETGWATPQGLFAVAGYLNLRPALPHRAPQTSP